MLTTIKIPLLWSNWLNNMQTKNHQPLVVPLVVLSLLTTAFAPRPESYWARQLRLHGKMNLPVDAIRQAKATSCGEAAFVMAYNYAYPETKVTETQVIELAAGEGWYTELNFPYTSPEDMGNIARHYADTVSTGSVDEKDEALSFLIETLTGGDPLIIDLLTRLGDPASGAHFVVVTGVMLKEGSPDETWIYFNDPLWGSRRAKWNGDKGVWNSWLNNGDPGGSGWWMVISSP